MELINTSGEPREYNERGFVYEFPFPASEPTKVPDDVGEKLLATGYFKRPDANWNKPVKKEEEKISKEVKEDAI